MVPAVLLVLVCAQGMTGRAAKPIEVGSPSGAVTFTLYNDEGQLASEVTFKGGPVIQRSPLGIVIDGMRLSQGVAIGKVDRYALDERYPWRGVHGEAVNRCRGARISIRHVASGTSYSLDVRAFDDGVGFRFVVPGRDDVARVPDAATSFRVPDGSDVWVHDLDRGHYEGVHTRKHLSDVKSGEWVAPPLTVRLPSKRGYAALTEAALSDYAGMALQADGLGGFDVRLGHAVPPSYPFVLRYKEDVERLKRPAALRGAITTTWRVVMVGPDLNTLVNSDILHNLSPPADPKLLPHGIETRWLKPGRAVWKYGSSIGCCWPAPASRTR